MFKRLLPPSQQRLPHYSFMRPGDFLWFVFFLLFSAWKFHSAFTLADRFFWDWFSYATVSLLLAFWYGWLRRKRRHLECHGGAELSIALMLPQGFQMTLQNLKGTSDNMSWELPVLIGLLVIWQAFEVWRAPKIAKELEELKAAAEEEARNGPADPRFIDIDKP